MANYVYSLSSDFPDGKVNITHLSNEIRASAIVTALDYISVLGDTVTILFKASLSSGDKTILDGDSTGPAGGLIAAHDNSPTNNGPALVQIQEETTPTNGKFQFDGRFAFCANMGTSTTFDTSFNHAISVLDFWWRVAEQDRGDKVTLIVGPDQLIGALTADAAMNDTVLNVQSTVVENIYPGDTIKLSDGTPTDVGRIIAIDKVNKTLTLQDPLPQAYLASAPTLVLGCVHIIRDAEMGDVGDMVAGRSKIGASYIPAGTVIRTIWTSNQPAQRMGFITADVGTSVNTIEVDATAAENIYWGDRVEISDGTNTEDLGLVTQVYRFERKLVCTNSTTNAYLAASPSYVRKTGKRTLGHVEFLR